MITIETQEITGTYYIRHNNLINKKNHIIKNKIKVFYEPTLEIVYFNLYQHSTQARISEELIEELKNKNLITYTEDKDCIKINLHKILIKFIDNTTEEFTFYEKDKACKAYNILLKSFKNGL